MGVPWATRTRHIVERATANLPQTAAGTLFNVTGGKVRVVSLIGEVTTAIQNQANNTKLVFDPSGAGSDVDLCAVLDIANDAVGTLYSITGTLATAMKSTTVWVVVPADNLAGSGLILGPGGIELNCAASNTGQVKWTIEYEKLDAGANIAAA